MRPALGMLDGQIWDIFGEGPAGLSWANVMVGVDREPRWRGQTSSPWPIGLHMIGTASVALRLGATALERLSALVHDVEEAILGDVPTPLKRLLRVETPTGELIEYKELERRVRARCVEAMQLPAAVLEYVEGPVVKLADRIALHAEARVLCHERMPGWLGPVPEGHEELVQWAAGSIRGTLRAAVVERRVVATMWRARVNELARLCV